MTRARAEAIPAAVGRLLATLRDRFAAAGAFGDVRLTDTHVSCAAPASAEPAFFRVGFEDGRLWVSLVTDNRWLSQSIEADLVHTGDKLEDLIDEELVDAGFEGGPLACEHFRSEDKLFTFRSPLPIDPARADAPESIRIAEQCLTAYEAAFRDLGDMTAGDDE